jgi:hypothetical protein
MAKEDFRKIFPLKNVGIEIADVFITASFGSTEWSVSKQVGQCDVQEAYTV